VSLEPKDRMLLSECQGASEPKEVLAVVQTKVSDAEKNRWVIKRSNGETVVLRDLFSKMASWVQKFIDLGDMLAGIDPIHAGLPWAAIKVILQVSVTSHDIHAAILEGLDRVCYLLLWAKIQERLYSSTHLESNEQLKRGFRDLYVAILRFLAKARRFCAEGKLR
jgi:hypothetical protein